MPPQPRPVPYSHVPPPPQSPYSNPPPAPSTASQAVSSPREPPSKSSTPQPASRRSSSVAQVQAIRRMPFYPQLPWYSPPEAKDTFPPRAPKKRRRQTLQTINDGVLLPSRGADDSETIIEENQVDGEYSDNSTVTRQSNAETPVTSQAPSESDNGVQEQRIGPVKSVDSPKTTETNGHRRTDTKPVVPVIPVIPQKPATKAKPAAPTETNGEVPLQTLEIQSEEVIEMHPTGSDEVNTTESEAKSAPKSWADLVRSKAAASAQAAMVNGGAAVNGTTPSRSGTIGEVLNQFDVQSDHKMAFLEPRGLVNTGNMCYMNSILQVLVFCIPFYDFLDQIGRRAAHSFKSDTPLLDAMIMFMREFKVIDSAESADKLRMRLKDNELEQYGGPLIPEYVYGVINRLPRFSSMRRGHQQDAEEFLGFLLAGLHDECTAVLRSQGITAPSDIPSSPSSTTSGAADAGWLEVGPKQKAAVTRQSGDPSSSSPVTRIFGGALRSELRVPGLKNSVTLEPYQPLQLDIGAPNINNITEALKGLTKPESLTGDFNSPRGPGTTATKQVFIESLPPILILHLKRFQYDSSGGTQKIWKRIGYPLDFELPKEVFPPAKRAGMSLKGGLPRYRLTAVVYHHGKSAAGGHYTVDLLRQDRREWVRVDDTLIRRIRPEDVAEAGAEEDPKVLAEALKRHQDEQDTKQRNPYEGLDGDQDNEDEGKAWSDVNGLDNKKRWAGVAATGGTATPSTAGKRTPRRDGIKDNKVAYILLYERISG
ncbi:Ubiquitin carboxyl-terminal hydrolase-like protein 7 [Elsinoe fawcettii]|nr:Ubiquitin carboxyl-terminal hydrolase-like protein 7 [Elsinoe fawcettii]